MDEIDLNNIYMNLDVCYTLVRHVRDNEPQHIIGYVYPQYNRVLIFDSPEDIHGKFVDVDSDWIEFLKLREL